MEQIARIDHGDGVVEITLNRPPVNALSAPFLMNFARLIRDLEEDPDVRAILLTSPFKVFSAGLDLKEAQAFDLQAQYDIVEGLNVGFPVLFACCKPTLVAVDGAAIAGGLFFVLASDYRLATPRASFGLAEVRVGADFPVGPMEIARATLDPNSLRYLMLTGQPISAEQAHSKGIVDEIVPSEQLREQALIRAREMARIPGKTFARVKRQIRQEAIDLIENAVAKGGNRPEGGWFNVETIGAMKRMIG